MSALRTTPLAESIDAASDAMATPDEQAQDATPEAEAPDATGADALEAALVRRAVAGDRSALEDLLVAHHATILRHIERKMVSPVRAKLAPDDVLQQTYLEAFKAIARFEWRGPGSFVGWLKVIATRKLTDAGRSRTRERLAAAPAHGGGDASGSVYRGLLSVFVGAEQTVGGDAMIDELRGAFHEALKALPENYATVVRLRYLEERSLEEVAEELGVSTGGARGLCHRARQALRDELQRLSRFV